MDFRRPVTSILQHPRWKWVAVFIVCELVTFMGLVNLLMRDEMAWVGVASICFLGPGMAVSLIKLMQPKVSSRPRDRYEVRRSAWNSLSFAFLGFGWAAGCYILILNRPESSIIAWPLQFLCIFIGIVAILQLADRRPIMVIDDHGVMSRDFGDKTVPWSEISGARIEEVAGTETLVLELREPDKYIADKVGGIKNAINLEMASLGLVSIESTRLVEVLDFALSKCSALPDSSYDKLINAVQESTPE